MLIEIVIENEFCPFSSTANLHYEKFSDGTIKCLKKEIPFKIPSTWTWVKLGFIGNWGAGATPNRAHSEYYGGDIPWLKTGDLNDDYITEIPETITELALKETSVKLNPVGSILIAMYGATIGKLGILTKQATTNQACCACCPVEGVYNKYLFYFLMSHKTKFINRGIGGAQPNISKEKIVATLMPLPPIDEQLRIVSSIESFFFNIERIVNEQLNISELVVKTKSKILDLAIRGKLVPQNPDDEPATMLLARIRREKEELIKAGKLKRDKRESVIFRGEDNSYYEKFGDGTIKCIAGEIPFVLPPGWCWERLGNVSSIARGGSPRPIDDYLTDSPEGVNWIKISDTEKDGKFIHNTKEKIKPEGVPKSRFVRNGDFLLTNSMSFGRPYILKTDGCIHDGWLVIGEIDKIFNQDFLYYGLSSQFMFSELSKVAAGSTVQNLKSDTVKNVLFPIPPLKEQKCISERIIELFSILSAVEVSLS